MLLLGLIPVKQLVARTFVILACVTLVRWLDCVELRVCSVATCDRVIVFLPRQVTAHINGLRVLVHAIKLAGSCRLACIVICATGARDVKTASIRNIDHFREVTLSVSLDFLSSLLGARGLVRRRHVGSTLSPQMTIHFC